MAAKLWIADSFLERIADGTIDLDTNTITAALVTSSELPSYGDWAGTTAYVTTDIKVPTVRNGHRYKCKVAGTTAGAEPTWPTTAGGEVVDGTVTWEEYGGDLCDLAVWADASANEVAAGNGYTTGGVELTTKTLTRTVKTVVFDADDAEWTALTKTMLFCFIYADGTVGAVTDPLIGYVLLDDTLTDVAISGVDFRVVWNASGILTWSAV